MNYSLSDFYNADRLPSAFISFLVKVDQGTTIITILTNIVLSPPPLSRYRTIINLAQRFACPTFHLLAGGGRPPRRHIIGSDTDTGPAWNSPKSVYPPCRLIPSPPLGSLTLLSWQLGLSGSIQPWHSPPEDKAGSAERRPTL